MQSAKNQNYIFAPTAAVSLPIKKRTFRVIIILSILLLVSFLFGLRMGSIDVTWNDVWQVLTGDVDKSNATETIYQLRLPRVVSSLCAGALMALSGYLLQTLTRNPLADPGVLGLTSGAILVAIFMYALLPSIPAIYATIATFTGAILTGLLTVSICRNRTQGAYILLVGIGISTTFSAFIDLLLATLTVESMTDIKIMISGSFQAITMDNMLFIVAWSAMLIIAFYAMGRVLTPLSLGDKITSALGIPRKQTCLLLCGLSILAMAPVVALVGAINFVGLISTFFAKNIIGYRGNELGSVSMLIGAIMTTWADTLGRTLFAPIMIHAGVFIALLGALMFIFITKMNTGQKEI